MGDMNELVQRIRPNRLYSFQKPNKLHHPKTFLHEPMKKLSFSLLSLGLLFALAAFAPTNATNNTPVDGGDIVDVAVAAGSFNTLVAAVQAAGLEETLRGPGPFTVFAPTDDAFDLLPEGTVESLLLPENQDQLISILTYHVVAGEVMSTDLLAIPSATTVNGQDASFGLRVGDANVTAADVTASNGVIHVIDRVLIP